MEYRLKAATNRLLVYSTTIILMLTYYIIDIITAFNVWMQNEEYSWSNIVNTRQVKCSHLKVKKIVNNSTINLDCWNHEMFKHLLIQISLPRFFEFIDTSNTHSIFLVEFVLTGHSWMLIYYYCYYYYLLYRWRSV